jgi:hypothetical protein
MQALCLYRNLSADDEFQQKMISLIHHPEQLEPMVVHLKAMAPRNASKAIAEDMLKEMKKI